MSSENTRVATLFKARVLVTLKQVVNDPQGLAVRDALQQLGYAEVAGVRIGKAIEITLEADDEQDARARVEKMARQLLTNPVIEEFDVEEVERDV